MRQKWYEPLSTQINNWPPSATLDSAAMFQVELGLSLLQGLGDLPISALPHLLKGHIPTSLEDQQIQIARARQYIPHYARELQWRDDILAYAELPARFRGFHVSTENEEIPPQTASPSVCRSRYQVFSELLNCSPLVHREPPRFAPPGRYAFDFQVGGETRTGHVVIPPNVISHLPKLQTHKFPTRTQREPVQLSLNDLRQTAIWMDRTEAPITEYPHGNWERRLSQERLDLKRFTANDELLSTDQLDLDGMFHLVGMVSAGKSALMEVIAIHLARQGKHVTLVVGDVMTALDKARQFNGLQECLATPILGRSSIDTHIARLQAATADERGQMPWASNHSGFRSVSLACPLLAMRDRGEPIEWVESREYPCEKKLYQKKETNKKSFTCPLITACPHHQAQRDLISSLIWIATPESLIYTSIPDAFAPQDFPEGPLYFARLVYHRSDLVIVDEVDTIQQRLDDMFSKSADLQDWFIDIKRANDEQSVKRKFDLGLADVLRNNDVSEMSRCLPQMFDLLRRPANKIYRRSYFSDVTLVAQIAQELGGGIADEAQKLRDIFDQFIDNPRGTNEPAVSDLGRIAAWLGAVSQQDILRERLEIREWIERYVSRAALAALEPGRIRDIVEQMRFALATTSAQSIFNRLRYVADASRNISPILGAPPFYRTVVPAAPMGNILSFLYSQDETTDPATLRVIDCRGVGRWLLLNFPTLFIGDGVAGPNMLVLSGTSWAGASPDFHVQTPVNGIMVAHDDEVNAIRESEFRFQFVRNQLGKPISISGISDPQKRQAALAELVQSLGQPNGMLEAELRALPVNRRRAVLFTASYEETIPIFKVLNEMERWKPKEEKFRVLRLIKDEDADDSAGTIRRGRVHTLAQTGAEILIAPLAAIERGHNILNSDKVAALGLAIFLVRTHPPPDDLTYALHSMNRWAIEEFEKYEQMKISEVANAQKDFQVNARKRWWGLLRTQLIYSRLEDADHIALTWSLLVRMYQVIGRLVRGGVPAKVIFCDAKFLPKTAKHEIDDHKSSLLLALRFVLAPYMNGNSQISRREQIIVQSLYGAMYPPIERMLNSLPRENTP